MGSYWKWLEHGCLNIKNDNGTITLFNKEYQVIGTYKAGGGTPIVPFLSVPDDLVIQQIGFSFERNITRSIYDDLISCAEEYLPNTLKFPELQFPDNDTIDIYNNMISISLCISILSVINFTMLYHFIIKSECIILTLPSYVVGTFINIILIYKVLNKIFEFFNEAYSLKVYLILFAVYFSVFLIILITMIIKTLSKSIIQEWKE